MKSRSILKKMLLPLPEGESETYCGHNSWYHTGYSADNGGCLYGREFPGQHDCL